MTSTGHVICDLKWNHFICLEIIKRDTQNIHSQKQLYLKTKSAFANHELGCVGSVQTIHTVCPKHAILTKEKEKTFEAFNVVTKI